MAARRGDVRLDNYGLRQSKGMVKYGCGVRCEHVLGHVWLRWHAGARAYEWSCCPGVGHLRCMPPIIASESGNGSARWGDGWHPPPSPVHASHRRG